MLLSAFICGAAAFSGGAPLGRGATRRAAPNMAHALIVQNKGGGHGEIGFHLAKALRAKGVDVTIVQDSAAKATKPPFNKYESELADCNVVWCSPTDSAAVSSALAGKAPLTHVFENYAKEPSDCEPALAAALASPEFKLFTFISSAGMYTGKGELLEDGKVKDPPTGQREVELALADKLPGKWCAFRPQYIYGTCSRGMASAHADVSFCLSPLWVRSVQSSLDRWGVQAEQSECAKCPPPPHPPGSPNAGPSPPAAAPAGPLTNKRDYLDWFLARASRGLPQPIPGDGSQLASLTHCEDVAALLASVAGQEAKAAGQVFNCAAPATLTYSQVAELAAAASGKPANIQHLPAGTKTSFPFRPNQEGFYVNVKKAQSALGWQPKHDVAKDLAKDGFYAKSFFELGLDKGELDTSKDGL